MSLFWRLFPHAPPAIEIELTGQLLRGSDAIGVVGIVAGAIGILAALSEPYPLDRQAVGVGASIGIALANTAEPDFDDLAASADAALYEAKRNGRGTVRFAKDVSSLRLTA